MSALVVFGSLNMDVLVTCERHPAPGETLMGSEVRFLPGGKGLNQAVAASKWLQGVTLLGTVGTDDFGGGLLSFMGEAGLDTSMVDRHVSLPTGVALITVSADGENSIVVVPGANTCPTISRRELQDVAPPHCIALAQFETDLGETEILFRVVRARGGRTILNPSPYQPIPAALLDQCSVLIVNEVELAQMVGGERSVDLAEVERRVASLDRPGFCYVVTLGAGGCLLVNDGVATPFPPVDVDVIDTTGAGDCFAGVFAACVTNGDDYAEAASCANTAAALSVTRRGAAPSMPSMHEVLAFRHEQKVHTP